MMMMMMMEVKKKSNFSCVTYNNDDECTHVILMIMIWFFFLFFGCCLVPLCQYCFILWIEFVCVWMGLCVCRSHLTKSKCFSQKKMNEWMNTSFNSDTIVQSMLQSFAIFNPIWYAVYRNKHTHCMEKENFWEIFSFLVCTVSSTFHFDFCDFFFVFFLLEPNIFFCFVFFWHAIF